MNDSVSKRGRLIVVSGPSGVGKTTVTRRLLEAIGAAFSVSMTTRPKTDADAEGVDYFFVNEDRFQQAIDSGELLEWARVFGRYYGTPKKPVETNLAMGRDEVLEIDVQGGIQVKKAMPEAITIFIDPPSEATLLERLRARAREGESEIQKRFAEAKREIADAHACGAYEHFVMNDDLEKTVAQVVAIVDQHR